MASFRLLLLSFFVLSVSYRTTSAAVASSDSASKVSVALYYETLCPYSANFIVNYLAKIFENGLISIVDLELVPYGNARIRNGTISCQHGPYECLLNTVEACAIATWPDLNEHFSFIYCVEDLALKHKYLEWGSCFSKTGLDSLAVLECYDNDYGKKVCQLCYDPPPASLHDAFFLENACTLKKMRQRPPLTSSSRLTENRFVTLGGVSDFLDEIGVALAEADPTRLILIGLTDSANYDSTLFHTTIPNISLRLELEYAAKTDALEPPHTYVPWVVVNGQPLYEEYEDVEAYICQAYTGETPNACTETSLITNRQNARTQVHVSFVDNISSRALNNERMIRTAA
ncbi:hypothetical protein ZIOFF_009601 [Zingiber officinale]|uniref:Gamma-interferon-inducible lysosomal thiol reductase n=1 Tax=Zingiber officinale TaxID=94328 RepID=A0A8J5HNB6_ZINOF|nr:hypothetical protein ZIOFF_009601 [Zingiber officinale]